MSKPALTQVSRSSVKKRVGLIVLLALITGAVAYPNAANPAIDFFNKSFGTHIGQITKGFVLGLDLQGGTRLGYEADVSKVAETERSGALNGVRDVIERRVNSIGVSEPVINTARVGDAWRVSVELAGIRDVNQAIKLIGETPILEFKTQDTDKPRDLTADEQKKMDGENASALKKAQDDLKKVQDNPNVFGDVAKADSLDVTSKNNGGDIGFIKDSPTSTYAAIYAKVKDNGVGIVPSVVELNDAYAVVKVDETKDAGQEIKANHILIQYAGAQSAPTTTKATKDDAKKQAEDIRKQVNPQNFVDMAKKDSQEPGASQTGGDLGWFGKGMMVPEFENAAFALKKGDISGVVESPFGFHIVYKTDERVVKDVHVSAILIKKTTKTDILPPSDGWKVTELTGKQLSKAQMEFDQRTGAAQVSLTFNDEGTKLFADITKANIGKPVAIFLDGQPISTPTVQSVIPNGQAVITGNFSIEDAKLLAQRLQAGALPVPIKLIAQNTVGPTLGQDSVAKSMKAGMWGFLFIAIFMLFWYRVPGFISILSLVLYTALSFMIFKVLPVTLTLSGIAGFILSLGIAVDANVLIFERLKEELRAGKPYMIALEEAFKRAWPSIRDGNATTLIASAVLYWFSSSIIKGFALTLAIGILISLFTAIVVTRNIMRLICGTSIVKKLPWLFLAKKD
jgi:preprotein translocase subunit SecD